MLDINDKCKYDDGSGESKKGVIHAIRYIDTKRGKKVLSYIVDVSENAGKKLKKGDAPHQPEQVELSPEQVYPE